MRSICATGESPPFRSSARLTLRRSRNPPRCCGNSSRWTPGCRSDDDSLQTAMETISAPHSIWDVAGRLALAMVFGGAIGLNREWEGKPAGLRTHALVALGG